MHVKRPTHSYTEASYECVRRDRPRAENPLPPHLLKGSVEVTRMRRNFFKKKALSSDPSSILKTPFEDTSSMHQLSSYQQHPKNDRSIHGMESSRKVSQQTRCKEVGSFRFCNQVNPYEHILTPEHPDYCK